ncbi:tRNA uracil 4-sulfurtransferase ThiI [[Mycoplasma] testudinis]|uniref:tRNA uracil 4-sulfurtransferase ThiI n=1 Tax=[Mycoplasma] testudinis TaxID=33924 RepID=UPI00055B6651|nr:tRNA uracil 4-sulfurtransferase ThiI [[Mycoplasma] testudinis]
MEVKTNCPIIVVKYGELSLKGKNQPTFVSQLQKNILYVLKPYTLRVKAYFDYLEIEDFSLENLNIIITELQQIPGISVIHLGYKIERDLELLKTCVNGIINDGSVFSIECKRKDKSYQYDSLEIKKTVASSVLRNHQNMKINLNHPEVTIAIEVTKQTFLVFAHKYRGLNGLPVGTSGKVLVLLSGGIDSPVAAHQLMKRGLHIDFLTFITPPHTSKQAVEKTKVLTKIVTQNGTLCSSLLYVCNFSSILHELNHCNPESYKITMMRRYFLKIAENLCQQYGYDAVATGDALGQVASQTITSLKTISQVTPNLLILRPLLGFDKNEIINYARSIGTYETSILPYSDACSLFAPKNPVTHPKVAIATKIEQELNLIDILIPTVVQKHTTIFKVKDLDSDLNTSSKTNY